MATLLLELSLTRIFSVVLYYHFAFLAISIALFGLGAGGVFSYVVAGWKGSLFLKLGRLSAANSALVFAASAAIWHNLAGSFAGRALSVALGLAILALIIINWKSGILDVHYAKGQKLENEIFEKWNSFSRIAVAGEKDS